jgi:hypothetical protein
MAAPVLPPLGPDWKQWGRQLSSYLSRQLPRLFTKSADDNPSENGILLWDEVAGYPVVSKNGEWRQVVLEDGHADYIITADVTAAATNTAYKLTYDAMSHNHGITLGTPASRIVFEEGGQYVLSFSAQVSSTSGSTVHFYFWPSINGINVDDSAMTTALHQNNATMVTSRTQVFTLAAGDYLEVNWMVDNVNGFLNYTAAASPRPALPASTLSITRLHG